jgi:hypothetical protein
VKPTLTLGCRWAAGRYLAFGIDTDRRSSRCRPISPPTRPGISAPSSSASRSPSTTGGGRSNALFRPGSHRLLLVDYDQLQAINSAILVTTGRCQAWCWLTSITGARRY